jgi:hyaluronan synthase
MRYGSGVPSLPSSEVVAGDNAPAWPLRLVICGALAVIGYASIRTAAFVPLVDIAEEHHWATLVVRPAVLWAAMAVLMLVVRTLLWFRYRADAPADLLSAPTLTVVIPAYNEGAMVARSIESIASANYPEGRLELFVIDDGSTDDTWLHIQKAAALHPDIVTTLRLPKNQGKRSALAEGFRRARGEFVVTVDSDSIIEPGALLALIGPFRRPRVGAVAGKVAVLNRKAGVIPRMLAVRFVLTFDLLRAVQSTYGTVYCCPGALTAYRTELVRRVLDAWMSQRFLGAPCTYGEDRAMTNAILAEGFDTVYQRTAVVHTIVPETYSQLCKMLLRWDRSYVREELRYIAILGRRPLGARVISVVESLVSNLRHPVGWLSLVSFLALAPSHPLAVPRMLTAIGIFAALNMLYYLHSERSLDAVFGVLYAYFSFFALFWIFPYAIVTVRARGWLTR